MALVTTFITTPVVTFIYKPARKRSPYKHRKIQRDKLNDELRILACIHGTRNIPSMINLIEASRGTRKSALRLYIMHLVELSERSSAIMMVHKARKNGLPFWNRNRPEQDQIVIAFQAYGQLSKVTVRPMTGISGFHSMHEDICNIADQKRAAMIILPFHKCQRVDGVLETVNVGLRTVNQRVLKHAPCSVGIMVDRGLGGQSQLAPASMDHHVAVLFFGGPDDREALAFGRRMAEHPGISLKVVRFIPGTDYDNVSIKVTPLPEHLHEANKDAYRFATAAMNMEQEKEMDDEALSKILKKDDPVLVSSPRISSPASASSPEKDFHNSIEYEEHVTSKTAEAVMEIARSNKYDLFLVGRGRFPTTLVADLVDRRAECAELGPIGDLLASPNVETRASVLVIQQHDAVLSNEAPFSKVVESATSTPFTASYAASPFTASYAASPALSAVSNTPGH
eukprot:TRINITY_DN4637_c0_g2_i1.p1 TRINITY_DN4637_c0_g2~~TRINITY_DN4637_c0_g2_i1.p1  ORF type:complete len:454 (-),score=27.52 TRINITY_DN4637_c0_g2_i1:277-1638(-)